MHQALRLHPDSRCTAVTGIEVVASRPGPGNLLLRYLLTGTPADLRMPPAALPTRADELWRHSCFEAFVCAGPDTAYYEFNFAPSTRWAAYRFKGYRSGMSAALNIGTPPIEVRSDGGSYELRASLALDGLPDLPGDAVWLLGLSAVIEEAAGGMSYWALAHPPGKPDFHHSDCFAVELPAAY